MGTFDMAMTVAGVKILVINGQGVGMPHLVMALSTRCMRPFKWQQSPWGRRTRLGDRTGHVTSLSMMTGKGVEEDRAGGRGADDGNEEAAGRTGQHGFRRDRKFGRKEATLSRSDSGRCGQSTRGGKPGFR